jgi:hypothetical protein
MLQCLIPSSFLINVEWDFHYFHACGKSSPINSPFKMTGKISAALSQFPHFNKINNTTNSARANPTYVNNFLNGQKWNYSYTNQWWNFNHTNYNVHTPRISTIHKIQKECISHTLYLYTALCPTESISRILEEKILQWPEAPLRLKY